MHRLNDTIARVFRLEGSILRAPPKNVDRLKRALIHGSTAQFKPGFPVLMCVDAFQGGTVETREYPNDDHLSLPQRCVAEARE